MKKLVTTLIVFAVAVGSLLAQGVTTASISGTVQDAEGMGLIGATIVLKHQPSGTQYGTVADENGAYRFANVRVGGPYRINVSYTGYGAQVVNDVFLRLGEKRTFDFVLDENITELEAITVTATQGTVGQNSGASTQITSENIEVMPTLNRDVEDYLRLTPQVSLNSSGGLSFAGINNRYNAIYVDGAVNNDVFGLASQGTNGGQTGIAPFSIDIIDQMQVVLSPYDVALGGFAGGGVNAVTKSGDNEFRGTAYYFTRDEGLFGGPNKQLLDRGADDEEVDPFSEKLYGASIGGPIIKDKLFFFANAEIRNDETPSPFDINTYAGDSDNEDLVDLRNFVRDEFGYNPGNFGDVNQQLEGLSFFGKIDWNINENHKLTFRHQYTKAEETSPAGSSTRRIRYANAGVYFPSTTNSTALELNSTFGTDFSNNLIVGFTSVKDERDPIGGDFPYVIINDGAGKIELGSEQFSTANQLDQDVLTITDNFKIYSGDHTFTVGTHNEFYSIYNLFIRQNYGTYNFDNLDQFLSGDPASSYFRSYSLVDEITGDGSAAAADFNAMQLGFYLQDEWSISKRFSLTGGIRLDVPIITDDPVHDPSFESETLGQIQRQYQIAEEIVPNSAPSGQLMWSPRIGFNYDIAGDRSYVVRGGMGVFTSRIPFVWPGAMFNNNGLTQGGVFLRDVDFRPDINNQYVDENFSVPSGDLNLFVEDFKYPQVFRSNLAFDFVLPGGISTTLEGIYTNTLNNVVYTNVNNDITDVTTFDGTPDTRNYYTGSSIDPRYSAIYIAHNTSQGESYTLTASFAKSFNFKKSDLNLQAAYTYGDAFALNEGTSSQNSSQWRGQVNIDGRNNPVFGRSDFATGHRTIAAGSFTYYWSENRVNATTISLFFNGQSGRAYSYIVGGGDDAENLNNETGSTGRLRSLMYIPVSQDDIVLVPYEDGDETVSASDQWINLDAFIKDDPYLSENRGNYAEKNSNFAPWESRVDLAVRQDFGIVAGGKRHKLQLTLDVFNFTNLLNNEWGVAYNVPGSFGYYELLTFEGFEEGTLTPTYTYRQTETGKESFDINDFASRWRGRLGIRYIFN